MCGFTERKNFLLYFRESLISDFKRQVAASDHNAERMASCPVDDDFWQRLKCRTCFDLGENAEMAAPSLVKRFNEMVYPAAILNKLMSDKIGILDDKVQIAQILFGEWGQVEPCVGKIDATFRLQPGTLERRPENLQQRTSFIYPFNISADETVINPNSMAWLKLVNNRGYARDVCGSGFFGYAARYGFTCEVQHISGMETDIHRIGADRTDGA